MEVDAEAGLSPGAHLTVNVLAVTETEHEEINRDPDMEELTGGKMYVVLSLTFCFIRATHQHCH